MPDLKAILKVSFQFLTKHNLTGSVKYVVKHTSKEVLKAAYRSLFETQVGYMLATLNVLMFVRPVFKTSEKQ